MPRVRKIRVQITQDEDMYTVFSPDYGLVVEAASESEALTQMKQALKELCDRRNLWDRTKY